MFTRLSHQSAANIYDRITKMMSPQQQGKNRGGKLQDIDVHMSSIRQPFCTKRGGSNNRLTNHRRTKGGSCAC